MDQDTEELVLFLYAQGQSTKEIGKQVGYSDTTVINILKKHNIPRRNVNDYRDKSENAKLKPQILSLRNQGYSWDKISYLLNISLGKTYYIGKCK